MAVKGRMVLDGMGATNTCGAYSRSTLPPTGSPLAATAAQWLASAARDAQCVAV